MRNVTRAMSRHSCFKTLAHLFFSLLLSGFVPAASFAKDAPLTAIVLFDGPSGPSYVQITAVTLNAKTELRSCEGSARIDKRSYDLLARVQLKSGSILDRGT